MKKIVSLFIEPIDDDSIETLSRLGKEKLKGKSIETLKKEAREEIEKASIKKYALISRIS